jgi:hypothetical protein
MLSQIKVLIGIQICHNNMIPVYLYIVSKDLHDAWYCIVPMVTAM